MKSFRLAISALAALAAFSSASHALASDKNPQTSGVVEEAQRWLTAAIAGPTAASEPTVHGTSTTAERTAPVAHVQQPFVDFSPNASVVARDWHGSMKIIGDRTLLLDDYRPLSANRMVMGRFATEGTLVYFAQVGAGEWRIDPALFPNARSYSEVAGQVGGGFELHITPDVRLAGEAQYTVLARDLHYTSDEVAPRMVAFFVAMDGRF